MRQELADRRRHVDRLRDEFDPHRPEATGVGSDIASSWRRCAPRLAVGQLAPRDPADPGERWLDSPLRSAAADVIAEFARLAVSENYIAALLDAEGEIVWSASGRSMARFAERAHFVPGTGWREDQAGTNAPGLVLCTGRPEAVFAREHWCMAVQDWVCYAAPVRSPSGLLVGVLDLSATWRQASPLALAAVGAMARVAEQEIAQSGSWERADLCLDVLGTPRARLHGEPVHLPLRQLEILTVLAVDGEISLESLYDKLYGEVGVSVATLKAEISHLRHLLGGCLSL
jgi:transcriptional regulator of acetoin/glycerol metabolism